MTYAVNKIRLTLAAAASALVIGGAWAAPAMANVYAGGDGPVACHDFQRGPNGSWIVMRPTMIQPEGVVMNLAPGQTFAKNQFVNGIEVTTVLDRNCGNM
jgi:hypothetical protein